jgi:hypothetical protein
VKVYGPKNRVLPMKSVNAEPDRHSQPSNTFPSKRKLEEIYLKHWASRGFISGYTSLLQNMRRLRISPGFIESVTLKRFFTGFLSRISGEILWGDFKTHQQALRSWIMSFFTWMPIQIFCVRESIFHVDLKWDAPGTTRESACRKYRTYSFPWERT